MPTVVLTKHHALGNDFLIALPGPAGTGALPLDAWAAAAGVICDRRTGIGADGLLLASDPDPDKPSSDNAGPANADLVMHLYNADGSTAEMSGNGIRCLAQAWARHEGRDRGEVLIATAAGRRRVSYWPGADRTTLLASVDMGPVAPIPAPAGWPGVAAHGDRPVAHLSVGNPHTVVAVGEVAAVDLLSVGQQIADVNLEIVQPGPEPAAITMRVHERGAGITEACGTGACAAAWAAAGWGMVDAADGEITVHMDGGDARVRLDQPAPGRVTLVGPATFVGTVELEL